nr:hypothetical protein StreXyl84_67520 [Streptomyces sp. Xyl84]
MEFLVASGVPERDAQMAMLAASRFTVGSVLEEQADTGAGDAAEPPAGMPVIDRLKLRVFSRNHWRQSSPGAGSGSAARGAMAACAMAARRSFLVRKCQ